jgi:hypothetical protein
MILIGIDIGYINMGVVRVSVDDEFNFTFTDSFRYNISIMKHSRVRACDCKIPHTAETCDRVAHFIQENKDMFDSADFILIERQPPMGFKDIEALLMTAYRHKVKLLSPNRLHKYFGISNQEYDVRKESVVSITEAHLGHIESFNNQVRKHDMADAACMCIYQIVKFKEEQRKKERLENIKRLPFDNYAFVPPGSI